MISTKYSKMKYLYCYTKFSREEVKEETPPPIHFRISVIPKPIKDYMRKYLIKINITHEQRYVSLKSYLIERIKECIKWHVIELSPGKQNLFNIRMLSNSSF